MFAIIILQTISNSLDRYHFNQHKFIRFTKTSYPIFIPIELFFMLRTTVSVSIHQINSAILISEPHRYAIIYHSLDMNINLN